MKSAAAAHEANQATLEYLRKLAEDGFYGALTLKFEAGRVVHIRKEESIRPTELSGGPR